MFHAFLTPENPGSSYPTTLRRGMMDIGRSGFPVFSATAPYSTYDGVLMTVPDTSDSRYSVGAAMCQSRTLNLTVTLSPTLYICAFQWFRECVYLSVWALSPLTYTGCDSISYTIITIQTSHLTRCSSMTSSRRQAPLSSDRYQCPSGSGNPNSLILSVFARKACKHAIVLIPNAHLLA